MFCWNTLEWANYVNIAHTVLGTVLRASRALKINMNVVISTTKRGRYSYYTILHMRKCRHREVKWLAQRHMIEAESGLLQSGSQIHSPDGYTTWSLTCVNESKDSVYRFLEKLNCEYTENAVARWKKGGPRGVIFIRWRLGLECVQILTGREW